MVVLMWILKIVAGFIVLAAYFKATDWICENETARAILGLLFIGGLVVAISAGIGAMIWEVL